MSGLTDLEAVTRKTVAADHSDGVMELSLAAILLVFAFLQLTAPALIPIFAAPIALFAPRLVLRAKQRITYSRIGYVELPREARGRLAWLALITGGLIVTWVVVAVTGDVGHAQWRRLAPFLVGALCSGGFLYAAERSGLVRYRAVAGLSLAAGAVVAVLSTGADYRPVSAYLLAMAVLMAAIGAVTLARFIRLNPMIDDTEAVDDPA